MARRTIAQKQEAESKAREKFYRDARKLTSWDEAWSFAQRGPSGGAPGGSNYTELAYFLRAGAPGFGATAEQSALFDELKQKLGPMKPRGFGVAPLILQPAAEVDPKAFAQKAADFVVDAVREGRAREGLPPLKGEE